ncbi:MAG: serine hydrolase [Saprospiraceae bacterium]|nr:serine hydrolase [Saprospiraceae bacterium]
MVLSTLRLPFLLFLLVLTNSPSWAQTGIPSPQMAACDGLVSDFLSTYNIPGATFAMTKNGKLVYLRAFGQADLAGTEPTQPYHRFRIASLSKPITSVAIMKLREEGQVSLDDQVFGPGGLLENHPDLSGVAISDARIYDITVQQLLEHSAGWNRTISCFPAPTPPYPWQQWGCDPIDAPLYLSQVTNTANPVSEEALIRFLLEKGLDFDPGTAYAYSNIGYLILGEIIETITGLSYEQYVQDHILAGLGICDMHLGKNLFSEQLERESEYLGDWGTKLSCYGTGENVPWEYGGMNVEAMDAHGGWIATARDLVRLLVAVDKFNTKPDILTAASINTMIAPSANDPYYAKGWSVNPANNWWHTGLLPGSTSIMARTSNGYTWALLLNRAITGPQSNNFWSAFDGLPWNCIASTSSFPAYDLLLAPDQNAADLAFSAVTDQSATVSWTNGDGSHRLLVARALGPVDHFPLDGTAYPGNASFGSGSDLGDSSYVVYNGSGNSITVTNLDPDKQYYFRLFEFNQNNATGNLPLYKLCNSEHKNVQTTQVTAMHEPNGQIHRVFPNPTTGNLTLSALHELHDAEINLLNPLGKNVQRWTGVNGRTYDLHISDHPDGMYLVEVINRGYIAKIKILKSSGM